MKIETIYFLERKNNGNYTHEELSATAKIEDGEDAIAAMVTLKDLVHDALYGTLNKPIIISEAKAEVLTPAEVEKVISEVAAIPVKAKRNATKKEKSEEIAVIPVSDEKSNIPDVIVEKVKPSKVTKYSSVIPEHKSIFGGYLAKKYQDTWKTKAPVEEIKAFTASLNGQDFIDDKGTIVPTFLELIHTFFGM